MEERKNKKGFWTKYGTFLGLAFFAVLVFFGQPSSVQAATCVCKSDSGTQTNRGDLSTEDACQASCYDLAGWTTEFSFSNSAFTRIDQRTVENYRETNGDNTAATPSLSEMQQQPESEDDSFSLNPIKWLLYGIFKLMTWIIGAAAILFEYMVREDNINFILENPGVYQSWAMVRDFLNLGFIMVLLYIAFCVVFQVGSYSDSWKKMLLMMVIMALLVNFSFSFARFIIDVSNIMFYWLFNVKFPSSSGASVFASITGKTGLGSLVSVGSSIPNLIAAIALSFIVGVTLMIIAILFLIRLVALGVIVIFAPIGIAGAAFPWSQKYASMWWDNLFKYSFFAPIMMLMIVISTTIMTAMSKSPTLSTMKSIAGQQAGTTVNSNFLGNLAFFAIPVTIMWIGMTVAQKFSIAGAATVTKAGQNVAKWAGKKFSGYGAIERQYKSFKAGMAKRSEDEQKKSKMYGWGRGAAIRGAEIRGMVPLPGRKSAQERARKMRESDNRQDIEDDSKKYIEEGMTARGAVSGLRAAGSDSKKAAAHARAFLKQDGDDRKNWVENEARSTGGGELHNMLNEYDAAERARLVAARADARDLAAHDAKMTALRDAQLDLETGGTSDQSKKDLHAFTNDFMKMKVRQGIKSK